MSTVEHRSISDTFKAYYMRHPWIYSAVIVVAVFLILWASSIESGSSRMPTTLRPGDEPERIFTSVLTTLDEAEGSRVDDVAASLIESLNQWIAKLTDREAWRVDPFMTSYMDNSLPQPQQREIAGLVELDKLQFDPADGYFIQECMWLSQVQKTLRDEPLPQLAPGDGPELARVVQLFDWTVCNIAPESDNVAVPYLPWQVVLHGRSRMLDRAWVFSLLCRQAGYDVVMLGRVNQNSAAGPQPGAQTSLINPWIPALVHNKKLYLFDHEYGAPIHKADGSIATLADVVADPSLLRALDIPTRPYPVSADDLTNVVAMIEASSNFLTRRMFILENHLSGNLNFGHSRDAGSLAASVTGAGSDHVRLSFKPANVAERLSGVDNLQAVIPWGLPYERRMEQQQKLAPIYPNDPQEVRIEKRRINVRMNSERFAFDLRAQHTFQSDEALINMMAQDAFLANAGLLEETEEERQARLNAMRTKTEVLWSVLLQGRLRYLEGILNGDRAASWFYQKSRPSAAEMAQMEDEAAAQTQVLLKVIQNSAESDANRRAASLQRQYLERMLPGKRDSRELATYWLGLLHFQKQSYGEAVVYFSERFLDDPDYADSELVPMARYNLARSLEKFAEAKQSQVSKAAPEEQEALRQEVKEMQQRALDYYENETEPLFVPQARARGVWYRKQLDAGEGS